MAKLPVKVGLKRCSVCKKYKPFHRFHKATREKSGRRGDCKECRRIKEYPAARLRSRRYRKGREKDHRKGFLRRNYKLSLDHFNLLLEQQNYCCKICGKPQSELKRNMDVDHIETRNYIIVRGLLCSSCNRFLGWYENNKEGLFKYLAYKNNWVISEKTLDLET